MNNQPPRSAEKIAAILRREKVAEFLRKGISSRRIIAAELGVSAQCIQKDIVKLKARFDAESQDKAAEAFCFQLASIQWRRKELIEQWERSKLDDVTTTDDGEKTTIKRRGQTAAAAYMAELIKLDEREDALLNLTKKDGNETPVDDSWRRLPPEQLMQRFRERLALIMPKNQENG